MSPVRRFLPADGVTAAASVLLAAMAAAATLVPLFARDDPLAIGDVLALRLLPPFSVDPTGAFHLLGTDRFGRDLFVRMMLAGRVSLAIGIGGSVLGAALGPGGRAPAGGRGGGGRAAPAGR